MPKPPVLDPLSLPPRVGSSYPPQFAESVAGRAKRRLGDALGLTRFGVNLTTLAPGAASALRHWHAKEDELVYVLEGELTLVTDAGEQVLGPGMAAGFPAGKPDGHCLVNRSDRDATYLEVGNRDMADEVEYPGLDLRLEPRDGERRFVRRNGEPY